MWVLWLSIVFVVTVVCENDVKEVVIEQGAVRGYRIPGSDVFAFYGIPYATVPTGTQKFRPPLPPPKWTEPFEAIDKGIICIQADGSGIPGKTMHEDCLIANVYVPDTEATDLPVWVTIHGGAYQHGYGTQSEPIALVNTKKILAVSFNYRLGAHGFLCLGTKDIPGNAGMKDQAALLRWVKENIASFGGNPEDITIEGCSAGAVSVDLNTLSPMTDGLFKKTITSSGSSLGTLAVQIDPIENAKEYAKILNFENVNDLDALEEFYKTASFETLISRVDMIWGKPDSTGLFVPCVEKATGEEIFLDDAPVNILDRQSNRGLSMLYGFTDMEGLLYNQYFDIWKDKMNKDFSDFLPGDLHFSSKEEKRKVAETIKEFYFGNSSISDNSIHDFIIYYTDTLFAYSMLRSVKLREESSRCNFYLYEYSFADENSYRPPNLEKSGANHCDQVGIIFNENTHVTDEYQAMRDIMREIWLNFITTGEPVPEGSPLPKWPPASTDRSPYMSLNSTLQLLSTTLLPQRAQLWDDIYAKYFKAPISPNTFKPVN